MAAKTSCCKAPQLRGLHNEGLEVQKQVVFRFFRNPGAGQSSNYLLAPECQSNTSEQDDMFTDSLGVDLYMSHCLNS